MRSKKLTFRSYKKEDLIVGDLVYHLLYGRDWVGLLCDINTGPSVMSSKRPMAIVATLPGTRYEFFFRKSLTAYRISDNIGYVSINWLYKFDNKRKKR